MVIKKFLIFLIALIFISTNVLASTHFANEILIAIDGKTMTLQEAYDNTFLNDGGATPTSDLTTNLETYHKGEEIQIYLKGNSGSNIISLQNAITDKKSFCREPLSLWNNLGWNFNFGHSADVIIFEDGQTFQDKINTQQFCDYSWRSSDPAWTGTCNGPACGHGTQSRTVWCQRSNGENVTDNFCLGTKPSNSNPCTKGANTECGFNTWQDTSACSVTATCQSGTKIQTRTCSFTSATDINLFCVGATSRTGTTHCDTWTYNYVYSGWSSCASSQIVYCGSSVQGTQTQTYSCKRCDGANADLVYCGGGSGTMSQACTITGGACPPPESGDGGGSTGGTSPGVGTGGETGTSSCFVAETKITMSDETTKNIEDVKVGDYVKTVNIENMKIEDKQVLEITSPIHSDMIKIKFETTENKNTFDHPYFVKEKGLASYKPDLTLQRYGIKAEQLEIGDIVYKNVNGKLIEEKILKITEEIKEVQTYNLINVEDNHNFFANGILVHNKCFPAGTQITLADGSKKNIEEVKKGEEVLSYNLESQKKVIASVGEVIELTDELYILNKGMIETSNQHPFYAMKNNGKKFWGVLNKTATIEKFPSLYFVEELEIGDKLFTQNNEWIELTNIEKKSGSYTAYNLLSVGKDKNYYANEFLVHNEVGGANDCFVAGTQINMEDGSKKNIEDVKVGDYVQTVNTETMEIENKQVLDLLSQFHTGKGDDFTIKIEFSDGTINQNTNTHPYYVENKGWASYKPELTKEKYNLNVKLLEIGDAVYKKVDNKLIELKIINITEIYEPFQTYNLMNIKDNHNFFANEILVHNKCFVAGTQINMADGTTKNIEDVEVGEYILGYSGPNKVLGLHRPLIKTELPNGSYVNLKLVSLNNEPYFFTEDHFFASTDGTWKSMNPELSELLHKEAIEHDDLIITQMEIGDELIMINKNIIITSLKLKEEDPNTQLYNFVLDNDHTYYANGYLVHNKKVLCTEANRQGYLSDELLKADEDYARKYIDSTTILGYHSWAKPLAKLMAKDSEIASMIIPLSVEWAKHMAYLMHVTKEDSEVGKILSEVGLSYCSELGEIISREGYTKYEFSEEDVRNRVIKYFKPYTVEELKKSGARERFDKSMNEFFKEAKEVFYKNEAKKQNLLKKDLIL
jgi:hypothetical protein